MTTRIPLLLATLLATQVPRAQAAPNAAPASDLPRIKEIFAAPIAAYARLHSYSGRFSSIDPEPGDTAIGTIQFAHPNRLAMQMQVKHGWSSYTYHLVCDGRFMWALDSRFKGRYTKRKVRGGVGRMMIESPETEPLDLCALLMGYLPSYLGTNLVTIPPSLDANPKPLRILSKPGAPVLLVDRLVPPDPNLPSYENKRQAHTKLAFRFGPDNLLRGSTSQKQPDIPAMSERHWDIKLNPKLPASTFTFKPAPGARQIASFD